MSVYKGCANRYHTCVNTITVKTVWKWYLPIVIYFEEIPNYLKCPGYQNKRYPIEKANTQLNKKAWVFTQLTWKLICFSDVRLLRGNCDCTLYNINKPFNFIDCRKHVCSLLVHVLHQFHTWMLCSWFRKKLHKQWALFWYRLSTPMFAINYDWIFEIEMVYKLVSNHLLITEWKKQENRFQNILNPVW